MAVPDRVQDDSPATREAPAWCESLDWREALDWLLDGEEPVVRHRALRELLDRAADDPEVVEARRAAMAADPIRAILAAQDPAGWWVAPGAGYLPRCTATTWQLAFLDQLGADRAGPRVAAACDYVIEHVQASNGGLGAVTTRGEARPAPSSVLHCLSGNLLRALIGFDRLEDERVRRAVDWQAAAITGEGDIRFYRSSVPGPGFRCGANGGEPCAWGATKALLALARIPPERRSPHVTRAVEAGVEFLLSRDPSVADYPMGYGNTKPSGSWFRLGFPSGYVADVLQVMEALCEAGAAADPRLRPSVDWLLAQQVAPGRWANRYAYEGKMIVDIDRPGQPSRWVTLRASRVLKAIDEARSVGEASA
jgi:hypothetical protein